MLIRLPFDPTKPLDTSDRLVVTFVDTLVEAANILLYLLSKKLLWILRICLRILH